MKVEQTDVVRYGVSGVNGDAGVGSGRGYGGEGGNAPAVHGRDDTLPIDSRRDGTGTDVRDDLAYIAPSSSSIRVSLSSIDATRFSSAVNLVSTEVSLPSMLSNRLSMPVKRSSMSSRRCSTVSGP